MITIFINDKPFQCRPGANLQEVLDSYGIDLEYMAAAIDYVIIPRYNWENTLLHEGNKVTLIKAAQGG